MRIISFVILFVLTTLSISAQNVVYAYDNAGNRTARNAGATVKAPQMIETQQTAMAILNTVSEKDISVYPNPTQGHFTMDISNLSHSNLVGDAYLYDTNGRLLEKKSLHSHSTHKKLNFNLSHKSLGTYILNLRIGENSFTWKVVKK